MAIIKATNSKASINKAIDYITKEEKTEEKLITGKDCNPETAKAEMEATKELYNKTDGRQYAHFVQSFNPKDNITPEQAHEIGKEFMEHEKFKGHEILMATHKDKDHIHNHFIVNSVNFESGNKFHTTKNDYQKLKDYSNELSKQHDLTVPEKSEAQGKFTTYNMQKYQVMKKAFEGKTKSYVLDTAMAIKKAQDQALNKEDFIKKMKDQGYNTSWKDTRKHITFENSEGKKVRLANLEKTFNDKSFSKEGLERGFKHQQTLRNREREGHTRGTSTRGEPTADTNSTGTNARNQRPESQRDGKQPPKTALDGIDREIRAIKERARANTAEARAEQRARQQKIERNTKSTNRESEHIKDRTHGGYERER